MRGPRRWAGFGRGGDAEAAPVDESEHVQGRGGEHAPANDAGRDCGALRTQGRKSPVAEDHQPVQGHVHDVRHDDDHHPRDRTADALEEEARRHVQQNPGKSVAERRQHPAASGRNVLGLSHREQERLAERAGDRHHRTGDRRVCKGGAPDRAALFRVSGAHRLSHHHDGAHQQPDPHEQQRNQGRDGDPVPGEVLPRRMATHRGVHGDDRQHPEAGEHDGNGETHGLAQVCAQCVPAFRGGVVHRGRARCSEADVWSVVVGRTTRLGGPARPRSAIPPHAPPRSRPRSVRTLHRTSGPCLRGS